MIHFSDTQDALDFIGTADSRETSPQIMEAIASHSANTAEAVTIWENGIDNWDSSAQLNFLERATGNGRVPARALMWGAAGSNWVPADLEWVDPA